MSCVCVPCCIQFQQCIVMSEGRLSVVCSVVNRMIISACESWVVESTVKFLKLLTSLATRSVSSKFSRYFMSCSRTQKMCVCCILSALCIRVKMAAHITIACY